jgi:hypothetical protein
MPIQGKLGTEDAENLSSMMLKFLFDTISDLRWPRPDGAKGQPNLEALRDTLFQFGAHLGTLASEFSDPPANSRRRYKMVASVPKLRLVKHIFKQFRTLSTEQMSELAEFLHLFGQVLERHLKAQLEDEKKAGKSGSEQET